VAAVFVGLAMCSCDLVIREAEKIVVASAGILALPSSSCDDMLTFLRDHDSPS